MRVCDKCKVRHGVYQLRCAVKIWDVCLECFRDLEIWFSPDQHLPEVPCTNCNKEEGEFIPQSEPEYHIDETIDKNRNVIMRRLMQGNKIIQEDFGKCSECGYYICRCPDKQ